MALSSPNAAPRAATEQPAVWAEPRPERLEVVPAGGEGFVVDWQLPVAPGDHR